MKRQCQKTQQNCSYRLLCGDLEPFLSTLGKIDLEAYPYVLAWIGWIKQLPGYIPMAGI
jgi:hypothetical protein